MKKSLLIVDDSKSIRDAVRSALNDAGLFTEIIEAENGVKAIDILLKNKIDFIISDVIMPGVDGYKLISTIKNQEKYQNLPVIMLTGQKDSVDKIKGLELLMLESMNKKLEKMAITDELTGLYNRRYFFMRFEPEFERCKRFKQSLICILIDIDHFKKVNDTYGHQVGDVVLKKLAKILMDNQRTYDIFARIGGEEFIGSLCNINSKDAYSLAERLRKKVEGFNFSEEENKTLHATISIGIGIYPHPDITIAGIDDIIKIADDALYKAKNGGRNKTVIG
ncbi:MAG: diguanylate cyclase [Nitrospirae bacterium]|nr:diguanylate cyclase [Nitrospirota bacterium]